MKLNIFVSLLLCLSAITATAGIIHQERSLYRNILVSEENGKRCLRFVLNDIATHNQSCRYLSDDKKLVFDYTKMVIEGVLFKTDAKRVLIVGLGGGTLPTVIADILPNTKITSVEIDDAVVRAARQYFDFKESDRNQVMIEDARIWIKRAVKRQEKFDLIILDAFNGDYIPEHLMTKEFLTEVKALLDEKGLVLANTFSSSKLYHSESATYQTVFPALRMLKSIKGNRVLLAAKHPIATPNEAELRKWSFALSRYDVDPFALLQLEKAPDWESSATILTDQFSPANLMR
jgi:spermidine synthase